MRLLITLLFLFATAGALRADVYVLCYHSFLGRDNVTYDFSLDELKSHLEFLKNRGFKFVSINDLTSGRIQGKRNILVTIDDGNQSVYDAYYKVFRPMGIKPLLGIYTFILGHRDYALTWDKLKKLSDDGCDIASHGFFHLKLNDRLYREKKKQFIREIAQSKSILEEKLKRKVDTFVYPFGLHSKSAIMTLQNSGYKYAFTIVNNTVLTPLSSNKYPFLLSRYMLTRPLYQGSLNTIARIADRRDKTRVSSLPTRIDTPGLIVSSVSGNGSSIRAKIKPSRTESTHTSAIKHDIRYGVAYAEVIKERKTEKRKEHSVVEMKRKSEKKDLKAAVVPPRDRVRHQIPELVKKNDYDLAFQLRKSLPEEKRGSEYSSSGSKVVITHSTEESTTPVRRPGELKARWNALSADIFSFYVNVIEIQLRKATQYIRMILGRLSR